jgi:hypothetical protein
MSKELKHLRVQQEAVKSKDNGGKTGWPPGLLQDDNRRLSQWFSTRLGAKFDFLRGLNKK